MASLKSRVKSAMRKRYESDKKSTLERESKQQPITGQWTGYKVLDRSDSKAKAVHFKAKKK